jgi:hypothetical protein
VARPYVQQRHWKAVEANSWYAKKRVLNQLGRKFGFQHIFFSFQLLTALIQHSKFWQAPVMIHTPIYDVYMLRVLHKCSKESQEVWDKHPNKAGFELFVVCLLFCGLPESVEEYIAICGADYINDKLTQRAFSPAGCDVANCAERTALF